MKTQQIVLLATLLLSLLCVNYSKGASFIPLGFLQSADNDSEAFGVSDNAAIVGGRSSGLGEQAIRWTVGSSVLGLGLLPGATASSAFALSADGQVLAGVSGGRAFRWSAQSGIADLGMLPNKTYHVAWGVSADGSIVVGSGDVGGNEEHVEPFRWTAIEGMVSLGFLPGTSRGEALAISRDGEVVVGYSGNGDVQAFRRGPDGIMRGLGFLPGYVKSVARSVSSNGSVIVGNSEDTSGASGRSQAFRWIESGGMLGLGVAAGFAESVAEGVSGDGSIVVGYLSRAGEYQSAAFIWDSVQGMRELQTVLIDQFGLNLTGWILRSATAISADGTAIVGEGTNPQGNREAWMVKLTPTQPTLSIRRFSRSVLISWPMAFGNFLLESRNSVAPADAWSPVTNAAVLSAGEFVVTNSVVDGARFFQLKSQ